MKNKRELPFAEIVRLKAPWVEEVKKIVDEYIDKLYLQLKNETEYDGVPEFMDEKYLYERFKENRDTNMWNGNWEVLKYFRLFFEIKVFKTMIGEWAFTEADREMYNYYNNVSVNDQTKCKSKQLKIKSGTKVDWAYLIYQDSGSDEQFKIYYEFQEKNSYDNNVAIVPYFSKFIKSFDCITNMLNNCMMLRRYSKEDFFMSDTLYTYCVYDTFVKEFGSEPIDVSCDVIKAAYEIQEEKRHKEQTDMRNIIASFQAYCMKNKKYKNIVSELEAMNKFLIEEFKKTSVDYNKLSEINKIEFEKQFK